MVPPPPSQASSTHGTQSAPSPSSRAAATGPDAWRVEVFRAPGFDCPDGTHALAAVRELGVDAVRSMRLGRGFLLSPGLARDAVESICAALLADPVVDRARITPPGRVPEPSEASHRILVAPRPGVMDPVANTVAGVLERSGRVPETGGLRVQSFRAWELEGEPGADALVEIGQRVLANETIETILIDREELAFGAPAADGRRGPVEVPLLGASDAELDAISTRGELSLTTEEMRAIQAHFAGLSREPTACELETLAQTWSEHCKHKTLTGAIEMHRPDGRVDRIDNLLRSTIARATRELDRDFCVSVFEDNAGIVAFEPGWDVCFKVETHNHPSAIDPYGGAGTGIGGVIRDILGAGLGARPIANTDCFFVGPTDLARDRVPKGCMHPRRILRGVIAGVRDYGNCMGIPTVSGGVWVHERYVGNPLVYAGTVGLIPRARTAKHVEPGDVIVAVGGRTGRDGIHGATFSSAELHEESETASSSAVQIGDPITEKGVLDCLLQARDRGLYRSVTDCGAGGFSSAVGEMGETTGAEVDLDRVPLKYPGLSSHEIWISEAQERMVFAVPPDDLEAFRAVFAAEDVEATVIGRFTDTRKLVLRDGGEVVGELDMGFLHDGAPRPLRRAEWSPPDAGDPGCPPLAEGGATACLLDLLALPNIASKEWIVRQYDHEVQGMSVAKPLVGPRADGPGDAAVLKPLTGSRRGLVVACGANPEYGDLDPHAMAAAAIDEALRNAVAVGGDPDRAVLLDNFSWGNCQKPDRLGSLVLAAEACYAAAVAYRTPFVSGKDSLNNEYRVGDETLAIPPTLLISCLAQVPDVARVVTMDAKRAGDAVYLVGETRAELGGSHLHRREGREGGRVPSPDLERAPRLLRALHAAIAAGRVAACHDLAEGGLAVAAAEMAFAGDLGLALELARVPAAALPEGHDPDATLLFSESCTRFLVEVPEAEREAFEACLAGLPCARIGAVVAADRLTVRGVAGEPVVDAPLAELRRAHGSWRP